MNEDIKIHYALEHCLSKSVVSVGMDEWIGAISTEGELTWLEKPPGAIGAVTHQASVVCAVASGYCVTDPGMDIIRHDQKDEPFIYNIDHYSAIENLPNQPYYKKVLGIAGVEDSDEIRAELQNNVYFVMEDRGDNHWVEEIPEHIRKARRKNGSK